MRATIWEQSFPHAVVSGNVKIFSNCNSYSIELPLGARYSNVFHEVYNSNAYKGDGIYINLKDVSVNISKTGFNLVQVDGPSKIEAYFSHLEVMPDTSGEPMYRITSNEEVITVTNYGDFFSVDCRRKDTSI